MAHAQRSDARPYADTTDHGVSSQSKAFLTISESSFSRGCLALPWFPSCTGGQAKAPSTSDDGSEWFS